MSKIFLLLFILFSLKIYAKSKDTIYIYFDYGKNQHSHIVKKGKSINSKTYMFMHSNLEYLYFFTGFDGYLSFKDKEQNKKAATKWLSKKFIKENKDIIFTYKEIEEMGFKNMIDKIDKYVVLLIDKKIRKKRKYKAQEVNVSYPGIL